MKGYKGYIDLQTYQSPCGEMLIGTIGEKLCLCDWAKSSHREATDKRMERFFNAKIREGGSSVGASVARQLDEYFCGKRTKFDIPMALVGTDFQKIVWESLLAIPYGKTISYKEQARSIDRPKAVRAVASANALNPVAIIVPCHRVIGSSGKLTGYAGGLAAKRFLLDLESGRHLI